MSTENYTDYETGGVNKIETWA